MVVGVRRNSRLFPKEWGMEIDFMDVTALKKSQQDFWGL